MMFEISTAIGCPIDCNVCPQDKMKAAYRGERLMSLETFVACIERIPADADVSFAGYAEPFLNRDCTAMIHAAHSRGHRLLLYTTCVGMDLVDVDSIKGISFKTVCLHLPDAKNNAKIHTTDAYLAAVDAMAEAFPRAQMMQMGEIHPAMTKYERRIRNTYLHSRSGNVTGTVRIAQRGRLECTQNRLQTDNVLLPNGDLVLCCMDYGLKHVLGNLIRQSYAEIFEGEPYKSIRAGMDADESNLLCRSCEFAKQA